jgi:hypothetical protein
MLGLKSKCHVCNSTSSMMFKWVEEVCYCQKCFLNLDVLCGMCKLIKKRRNFATKGNYGSIYKDLCTKCLPVFNHLQEIFYTEIIEENIYEYLKEYQCENRLWRNSAILPEQDFNVLLTFLKKTSNSGEWAAIFLGFEKYCNKQTHPIMLDQDQTVKILDVVKGNIGSYEQYKFIHAMAPNILLLKKSLHLHDIFRYYDSCHTKEQIITIWKNKFTNLYNCDKFKFNTCSICLESMYFSDKMLLCNYCENLAHMDCKIKFLKQKLDSEQDLNCELCKSGYDFDKECMEIINHAQYQAEGMKLRLLKWNEYLKN